jgi:hypothetical protein
MRVSFYSAAVVAASVASVTEAVRLEDLYNFAQIGLSAFTGESEPIVAKQEEVAVKKPAVIEAPKMIEKKPEIVGGPGTYPVA